MRRTSPKHVLLSSETSGDEDMNIELEEDLDDVRSSQEPLHPRKKKKKNTVPSMSTTSKSTMLSATGGTSMISSAASVDIVELEQVVMNSSAAGARLVRDESSLIVLNPFNLGGYAMICCLVWGILLIASLQRLNRKIKGEHFDSRVAYTLSTLSSVEIIMLLFTQASLSAKHGIMSLPLLRTEDYCGYLTEVCWRAVVKVLWILNAICTIPVLLLIFALQKVLGGSITGGRHGVVTSKRKSGVVSGDKIRWDPNLVLRHMWLVSVRFSVCPPKSKG